MAIQYRCLRYGCQACLKLILTIVLNIFSNLVIYFRLIVSISDAVVRIFAAAVFVIVVNAEYNFFSKLFIVYYFLYWNILASLAEKVFLTESILKCLILKNMKLFCR